MMDDNEVAEYVCIGKETDIYAKRSSGDSRMQIRESPLRSKMGHGLSSCNRENFRRKISKASPDGNRSSKNVGYEELVDAEKSRLKRVRSSPSDSDEEDARMKELTKAKVVNSMVIEKQQRELDFYLSKTS
jgi:hypothetical protein